MGSGSQINAAPKLIGRRNYCDECVMARRRWRPVWIRVSTWQSQTQTALCVLIYPEKPLQPLGSLLPDPLLLRPSPLACGGRVILQDLDGPQAQTLKWALVSGGEQDSGPRSPSLRLFSFDCRALCARREPRLNVNFCWISNVNVQEPW